MLAPNNQPHPTSLHSMHKQTMVLSLYYLPLLLITGVQSRECGANSEGCETLFRAFEDALLANGSNLFNLRRLFYPPSSQLPELANITYYVKLGSVAMSGELKCDESVNLSYLDTGVRYGWTTIGIYTFIHPALLNQLQVQLPFAIMKIYGEKDTLTGIEPFLWDGFSRLPSAEIYLNILSAENVTCAPPFSQVDEILRTITSLVRNHVLIKLMLQCPFSYTAEILCTIRKEAWYWMASYRCLLCS